MNSPPKPNEGLSTSSLEMAIRRLEPPVTRLRKSQSQPHPARGLETPSPISGSRLKPGPAHLNFIKRKKKINLQ